MFSTTALKVKDYLKDKTSRFSRKSQVKSSNLPRVLPTNDEFMEPGENVVGVEDVSLFRIQYEGMSALLQSRIPLLYFMIYCLSENHSESILFLLEIQALNVTGIQPNEKYQRYKTLYVDYFTESGQLMLELPVATKLLTKELLKLNDDSAFDVACLDTITKLQPVFECFLKSDLWTIMALNLGLGSIKRTMTNGQQVIREFEGLIVSQIKAGKSPCYTTKARKLFWHSIGQIFKKECLAIKL